MNNFRLSKNFGFTMAEILISLTVIGVVAAITMPALITKYQKLQTVNQLKKAYTILNNTYKMSEIDNGTYENWSKIEDEITPREYAEKYFIPYVKAIRTCKYPKNCYPNNPFGTDKIYGVIINNGMGFWFRKKNGTMIIVDINGLKKGPNDYGRDMFVFYYSERGARAGYSGRFCDKSDKEFCAGKIIYDGWKIKDDYPW